MLVFAKIRQNNKDTPESLLRRGEKKKEKPSVSGRQFNKFILRIPDDF